MTADLMRHGASPFDTLRQVRDDGTEYWSARDLMPLMAYARWQHFEVPLCRAMASAQNQGVDVASNFTGSRKVSGSRGPYQEDFELSRFACYLVAMNGDPNKPEVAAAQMYFAVRTRQAETSLPTPQTREQRLAMAVLESQEVIGELTERVAKLEPKAEAFEAFLSTTGDYSIRDAAHVLSRHHDILTGEKRLRGWMLTAGWLYRDPTGAPRAYQRRIDQSVLAERVQWHYHPETGEKVADAPQVRVTAKGIDALARALTKTTDQGEFDMETAMEVVS